MEETFGANIEAEIAELENLIRQKRNSLEQKNNIVSEKELVRQSVMEMGNAGASRSGRLPTSSRAKSNSSGATSYLDHLDEESVAQVNQYIDKIERHGLKKTLKQVEENETPFIQDAVHDVLTDKLLEQLKKRGQAF